jgi:hypothetical protein
MGFEANAVFVMVHTFGHLLINQLSFDCGYSSTSLRERIYCGPADDLYAGVLIYTADSDCKSASHLTPYRLPTLTPPMACEVIASAQEISSWLGSRLGADRGQSSEPIHNCLRSSSIDGLGRRRRRQGMYQGSRCRRRGRPHGWTRKIGCGGRLRDWPSRSK